MEHKIVISGEGSAHPKLGVKKKNSVEENLKILNDMIESGKLSLDHAIAKTKSNGTLRGIFKCSEDERRLGRGARGERRREGQDVLQSDGH